MVVLRQVGVMSVAKVAAVLMAIVGLIEGNSIRESWNHDRQHSRSEHLQQRSVRSESWQLSCSQ